MLRIESCAKRRLAIGAALVEFGYDGAQLIQRQLVTNRQHQGQRSGEPVAPVPVRELLLDGGLGDLLDGLAGNRQSPS